MNTSKGTVKIPRKTVSDVFVKDEWLILGKNTYGIYTRVYTVGKRKIYNAVFAAKRHRRFCHVFGKSIQSAALTLQTGRLLPHHYINGTFSTLKNFFGKYSIEPTNDAIDFSGKTRIVDRVCEFIEETVDYYETEHYVFVHGWLPQNALTPQQRQKASAESWAKARWIKWTDRYDGTRPLPDKTLICGHMPTFFVPGRGQNDSDIFYGNGFIAIDAGTADTKRVNVLVLEEEGEL